MPLCSIAGRPVESIWIGVGLLVVQYLRERLGLPIDERSEYTTLAEFVLFTLGSVPKPGASFSAGGHAWTVADINGPRIERSKSCSERPPDPLTT